MKIRSGDIPLGVPFNTTQYAVLTHMIAQATGLKPGILTHVINNAHIYENQVEGMKEQVARYDRILEISKKDINTLTDEEKEWLEIYNANPTLNLNKDITDFYEFNIEDIEIKDYKRLSSIKMPVAV